MFGSMSTPEDNMNESDFSDFKRHFFIPNENANEDSSFTDAEQQTEMSVNESVELFKIHEEVIPETSNKIYTVSVSNRASTNCHKVVKLTGEDRIREFLNLLLKYIGAAMMVSGYIRSRPDLRQMAWGSRLVRVLPPSIIGYLFGRFITPIGMVLMMFRSMNRRLQEK